MPRILLILALAAVFAGCASTAPQGAVSSSDDAAASAETQKPKKRCYREKTTGSRLGERVCVKAK